MFHAFIRYPDGTIKKSILKFRQIRFFMLIIASVFLLQGCIEITEEVRVNDDGSGSMSLSLSTGDDNPLLALIGQYADVKVTDELKQNARQMTGVLRYQEGISNVRLNENRWKGSISLSFDFEDDRVLNDALYAAAGAEKTFFQPSIYKIRDHKFVRKNTTRWLVKLLEEEQESIPDEVLFDLVEVTSVYHIPHPARKVKSSPGLKAAPDRQTFSTTHFLSDMVNDGINTKIKIKY